MPIFLNTAALFLTAMVAHFVLWKVRLPKKQLHSLLIIFVFLFLAWLALSLVNHASLLFILHVAVYYWSVSLCYTITYTAIEADSPTLSIMRFVASSGLEGRSAEEIVNFMATRPFIRSRLVALLKSGLVQEQNQRYRIAGQQPISFRMILGFRKLYGSIPKGG
jgi:hypothetical protein